MLNPSHSAGGTGQLFPDATLSLADGGSLSIDSFRPRYDLVILMLGVGAMDAQGQPATSFYVTDRYREIYATMRPEQPGWPARTDDVLQWLTFINIQCPECSPPEW